ncbi:MAG: MFS transporter [Paludibacter sp.]|jgi:GPH family glycoside/pentoside/hexuronide:cation symporter|nr:MFS transporter [Paludibacter sp.]
MKSSIKNFFLLAYLGDGFYARIISLNMLFYFTDIVKFSPEHIGIMVIISNIANMLLAPLSGLVIDTVKPMRWGKIRSWLLICPLGILIFFPLLFVDFFGASNLGAVSMAIVFVATAVFVNFGNVTNFAIIPLITNNETERTTLVSSRITGASLGLLLAGVAIPFLTNSVFVPIFHEKGYLIVCVLACLLICGSYYFLFRISRGYETAQSAAQSAQNPDILSLKRIFGIIAKTKPLIPVVIADTSSTTLSYVLPALAVYYFSSVAENSAMLALFMLVIGITGVLGSYFSRFIIQHFQGRNACLLVYPLVAVALVATKFVAYDPVAFIAINGLLMFLIGTTQPIESRLYLDTITYSEWKTGVKARASIISISNVASSLAGLLNGAMLSLVLIVIGYTAGATTPEVKRGIVNFYSLIPAALPIIAWLTMLFFYKITPEKLQKVREEMVVK